MNALIGLSIASIPVQAYSVAAAVPVALPLGYALVAELADRRLSGKGALRLALLGLTVLSLALAVLLMRIGSLGDMTDAIQFGGSAVLRIDRLTIWISVISTALAAGWLGLRASDRAPTARAFHLVWLSALAAGALSLPVLLCALAAMWVFLIRRGSRGRLVGVGFALLAAGCTVVAVQTGRLDLESAFKAAALGASGSTPVATSAAGFLLLFAGQLLGFVAALTAIAGARPADGSAEGGDPVPFHPIASLAIAASTLAALIRLTALLPAVPGGRFLASFAPLAVGACASVYFGVGAVRTRDPAAALARSVAAGLGTALAALHLGFKAGTAFALLVMFTTGLAFLPALFHADRVPAPRGQRWLGVALSWSGLGVFPAAPLVARLMTARYAWTADAVVLTCLVLVVTLASAAAGVLGRTGGRSGGPYLSGREALTSAALLALLLLLGVLPGLAFEPLWRVDAGLIPAELIDTVLAE